MRGNEKQLSEEDDLQKALELSKKEEQDRMKTVEKYNELSMTEDWEVDSKYVSNCFAYEIMIESRRASLC